MPRRLASCATPYSGAEGLRDTMQSCIMQRDCMRPHHVSRSPSAWRHIMRSLCMMLAEIGSHGSCLLCTHRRCVTQSLCMTTWHCVGSLHIVRFARALGMMTESRFNRQRSSSLWPTRHSVAVFRPPTVSHLMFRPSTKCAGWSSWQKIGNYGVILIKHKC